MEEDYVSFDSKGFFGGSPWAYGFLLVVFHTKSVIACHLCCTFVDSV